jgi:paired amphipathic helix protein Sin3a
MKRVADLFNGHPSLIQGFNIFTPVGYRLECSTDVHNLEIITIITPTGTTMQSTDQSDKVPGGHLVDAASNGTNIPSSLLACSDQYITKCRHANADKDPRMDGQAIEPAGHYIRKMKHDCHPETYLHFLKALFKHQDEVT